LKTRGYDHMKRQILRAFMVFIQLILVSTIGSIISCGGGAGDDTGGSITLSANPSSIPADGYSSTAITATLIDGSGSPALWGTEVAFSTTHGSFNEGTSCSAEVQNTSGTVTVSLIAGRTPGTALVTCSYNGMTQSIQVGMGEESGGGTAAIALTSGADCLLPDGHSSAAITATLTDRAGQAVPVGTVATFSTTLGSFSGGSSITAYTSDDSGTITVSLIAGTTLGIARVSCFSNGVVQMVNVAFDPHCGEEEEEEEEV